MAEARRIFAPAAAFGEGGLLLEGELLRHLRTVLRLGPGDEWDDGLAAEAEVGAVPGQIGSPKPPKTPARKSAGT